MTNVPNPEESQPEMTPTAQSRVPSMPPTAPGGLPLGGANEPGVRELVLAFRSDWENWKGVNDDRMSGVAGSLKMLDARQGVIESDFRQLRSDVTAAKAEAAAARMRADTAHTMAETASVAAGRTAQEQEAEKESLLAALTDTRGKLEQATSAIGTLKTTDEELKVMVAEAAKDSAGAAIREVVGKNPKLVAGIGMILVVLAQVLSQRFLVPPAAPNQGALPGPTPTVHTEAP